MAATSIEWTDYTWNPWSGCTKVSPGCAHCWAEKMGRCFGVQWGPTAERKVKGPDIWEQPLAWNRAAERAGERRRVFALSMGDWLDDRPELVEPLARLLKTIHLTPNLDWLLVTKRPELWERRLHLASRIASPDGDINDGAAVAADWLNGEAMPNVWVLASVENQEWAEKRILALLGIPARVHGLSCEPLLGPIYLRPWLTGTGPGRIGWVIAGGESGPQARPCDFAWLRSLRDQCREAGVHFFLKQLGSNPHGDWLHGEPPTFCLSKMTNFGLKNTTELSCCKNGRWQLGASKGNRSGEWPEDLRVREFPEVRHG